VTVDAECTAVDGRRLTFRLRAHDGLDLIAQGRHQRAVVEWDRFNARVADKARSAGMPRS
jgi:fluoroacetyl-CoA thioesterase